MEFNANKLWVALAAPLSILATAASDGSVTSAEWIDVGLAFLAALGVYQVSNQVKS